eukprot:TRINITY_DN11950_c0_g2_i3.p1 TRINITY_DN11950_c0_g2~~TRINITY_DN11950_c0_g2_i3.p1  ORF type:complete len:932 (+),score=235.89 TRINITY_DN11950_c0_g2_i3:79-2874(+)
MAAASCLHEQVWKGLCTSCGACIDDAKAPGLMPIVGNGVDTIGLSMRRDNASAMHEAETQLLLKNKQLILILDLDKTLIHTTVDDVASHWIREGVNDIYYFRLGRMTYFTKTRPGLHAFLEKVKPLYQLHVYTMGTRPYAKEILKIIDPKGTYFANRIITQNESFNKASKSQNLEALLPNGDRMAVIVDDLPVVWDHRPNLIPAVPYEYFKDVDEVNAVPQQKRDRRRKEQRRMRAYRRLATSNRLRVDDALDQLFAQHFARPATFPNTTTTHTRVSVSTGDSINSQPVTGKGRDQTSDTRTVEQDRPPDDPIPSEDSRKLADMFATGVAYSTVVNLRRAYDFGLEDGFQLRNAGLKIARLLNLPAESTEALAQWCDNQQKELDVHLEQAQASGKISKEQRLSEADMAVRAMEAAFWNHASTFVAQQLSADEVYRATGSATILLHCKQRFAQRQSTNTDTVTTKLDKNDKATLEVEHQLRDAVTLREPSEVFQRAQAFVLAQCCALRNVMRTNDGMQGDLGAWIHQQVSSSKLEGLAEAIASRARCLELLDACLLIRLGRQSGPHRLWQTASSSSCARMHQDRNDADILRNLLNTDEVIRRRLAVQPPRESDTALDTIGTACAELHFRFYQDIAHMNHADARELLPDVRLNHLTYPPWMLADCTIVFTAAIPQGNNPKHHVLYQQAQAMGATIAKEVDELTTHVVAGRPGTAKLSQAMAYPGTRIVHLSWIHACFESGKRQREESFPLAKTPTMVPLTNKVARVTNKTYDDKDEPTTIAVERDWASVFDEIDEEIEDLNDDDDDDDRENMDDQSDNGLTVERPDSFEKTVNSLKREGDDDETDRYDNSYSDAGAPGSKRSKSSLSTTTMHDQADNNDNDKNDNENDNDDDDNDDSDGEGQGYGDDSDAESHTDSDDNGDSGDDHDLLAALS